MIRYRQEMARRTETEAQQGSGTLQIARLFTLEETEGCASVCDVFSFAPGDSIGEHRHVGEGELYYILCGEALVTDDGVPAHLFAGDAHYCQDGHRHSVENCGKGEMKMLAVVLRKQTEQV